MAYNSTNNDNHEIKSTQYIRHRRRRQVHSRTGKSHRRRQIKLSTLVHGGPPFLIFLAVLIILQLYIFFQHFQSPSSSSSSSLVSNIWKRNVNRTDPAWRKVNDFISKRISQKFHRNRDGILRKKENKEDKTSNMSLGGVVIVGMHRSGTSMLTGVLVEGFGFHVGQPLIQPSFDNEKGFYELLPVVLQNDEFMADQHIDWSYDVIHYNPKIALHHFIRGNTTSLHTVYDFTEGTKALEFLNHPQNHPWVLKDPRLCITLPTWIPLLHDTPAIVFTYRHPLEVAASLAKRQGFTYEHALRLWIVYNMRGIQNSKGLCRVYSSNDQLLAQPYQEVSRIVSDLIHQCHVLPPSKTLSQQVIDTFVDGTLQHVVRKTTKQRIDDGEKIIQQFSNTCVAFEYKSTIPKTSNDWKRERSMYLQAMKIFCDFENGDAFHDDYEWPNMIS